MKNVRIPISNTFIYKKTKKQQLENKNLYKTRYAPFETNIKPQTITSPTNIHLSV